MPRQPKKPTEKTIVEFVPRIMTYPHNYGYYDCEDTKSAMMLFADLVSQELYWNGLYYKVELECARKNHYVQWLKDLNITLEMNKWHINSDDDENKKIFSSSEYTWQWLSILYFYKLNDYNLEHIKTRLVRAYKTNSLEDNSKVIKNILLSPLFHTKDLDKYSNLDIKLISSVLNDLPNITAYKKCLLDFVLENTNNEINNDNWIKRLQLFLTTDWTSYYTIDEQEKIKNRLFMLSLQIEHPRLFPKLLILLEQIMTLNGQFDTNINIMDFVKKLNRKRLSLSAQIKILELFHEHQLIDDTLYNKIVPKKFVKKLAEI